MNGLSMSNLDMYLVSNAISIQVYRIMLRIMIRSAHCAPHISAHYIMYILLLKIVFIELK